MSDLQTVRDSLVAQAEALAKRVEKIEAHLRGVDRDTPDNWRERAQFLENDEVLEALDEHDLAQIGQIKAALARVDAGTYGECADCGEAIAVGRLKALPTTTTCIDCAS